jgi:hypothetical protein
VTDNEGATTSDTVTILVKEREEIKTSKPVFVESAATQWYLRIVAENPVKNLKTTSTQLGELEEEETVVRHTLKALTPFGGSYLDIVFRNPQGVEAGDYKVNFHQYEEGVKDVWKFTVRSSDTHADISLTWRGLYVLTPYIDNEDRQRYKEYRSVTNPLIRQMKLVDSSNGNEVAAVVDGKVQIYSFNMDGQKERTFEWVVETEEVNISTPSSKVLTPQKKVLRSKTLRQKKSESFDLTQPPMIKEDMHGK